ncbi:hypothetical protein [uncultured Cellulomonas sp.]|uniref:hypothetical protein n=1 Tax=uncultured Cellulomonas sp. TaxID=189682 RepID=UPI0028E2F889|nr:hypothetical protein [uncultured Cellulomonas sp.]
MLARRFFWVGLPGGQVVIYRPAAPERGPIRDRAWRIEMDLGRSVAAAQELDQ